MKTVTLVIPSYNNLRHLKNAYASIKKHAPEVDVVLLDDGSTDGSWEWIEQQDCIKWRSDKRVGHTILYDIGINLANTEIVGIMHADMIMGPNYIQNGLKHLKPGVVVCGTRIEPPLHPPGREKIIQDFGTDFDNLNIPAFEEFAIKEAAANAGLTTRGMFAPWILYKSDFVAMGGHDAAFAPFPYEDSDIFQRWLLAGYELIQSRDAFVYHLTCRGHRWTERVQKDDDYYKTASRNAARNYLRKWGTWIKNDEYQHPILPKVYDVAFKMRNASIGMIEALEPWCKTLFVDGEWAAVKEYCLKEQQTSAIDLDKKIKPIDFEANNDVVIEFDARDINGERFSNFISKLDEVISQVDEPGVYEWDVFKININSTQPLKLTLPFLVTKNVF